MLRVLTKPGFGLPLGEGDFVKGERVQLLFDLAKEYPQAAMMVELKGNSIDPDGWIKEFHRDFSRIGGMMVWHPGQNLTKRLTGENGKLTSELVEMAGQAKVLAERNGLLAVTVHLPPAVQVESSADAGLERYNSPIGAAKMFTHITEQVVPIQELNSLMGGLLCIETLDCCNFIRGGRGLPTYLALQTGGWLDLAWLAAECGVRTTADSEHMICSGNLLMRRRDLAEVPKWLPQEMAGSEREEMIQLEAITHYWLRKGYAPLASDMNPQDLATHFEVLNPYLYHFGGAVQGNLNGTLGTHLPYDAEDVEQMAILDLQLWRLRQGKGIGGVIEVTGQLEPDKYDPWSPRIADDDKAKEHALRVVLDRWTAIAAN